MLLYPLFPLFFLFIAYTPCPKHDVKLHNYALTTTTTTCGMLSHMRKNEHYTSPTSKTSLKPRGHMTQQHKKGKGYLKGQGRKGLTTRDDIINQPQSWDDKAEFYTIPNKLVGLTRTFPSFGTLQFY